MSEFRPEESYRRWCVVVCDLEISCMRKLWYIGGLLRPTPSCCAQHPPVAPNTLLLRPTPSSPPKKIWISSHHQIILTDNHKHLQIIIIRKNSPVICYHCFKKQLTVTLNLNPLTWKIWRAPKNVSRWQKGFNLVFKGLICLFRLSEISVFEKWSNNWQYF